MAEAFTLLYTVGDAAKALQRSSSWVRETVDCGVVTPLKTKGGTRILTEEDVEALRKHRDTRREKKHVA